MSKDIRSFFNVVPKKSTLNTSKKRAVLSDSDEDTIDFEKRAKKQRTKLIVLSDSEDELPKKSTTTKKKSTEKQLKPVNISDVFGNTPIKQSKVVKESKSENAKLKLEESTKGSLKKGTNSSKSKTTVPAKLTITISDSDETNDVDNNVKKHKTKLAVLSDSEDELPNKSANATEKRTESQLKPVTGTDAFGKSPVKQSKVVTKTGEKTNGKKTSEVDVHDDPDLNKTLLELDEEEMMNNLNVLNSPTKIVKRKNNEDDDLNNSDVNYHQEMFEKRRQNYQNYQNYLNRGKPPHLGQKEYPKGKPDSLKNLCFLRTGVLDSMEGDDFEAFVKEHGARIVHAVSKKVNYVVVGEGAGPAKLEKARNYRIETISEDELLDMVLVNSGMPAKYVKQASETTAEPEKKKLKLEESTSKSPKLLPRKETTPSKSKTKETNDSLVPVTMVDKSAPGKLTMSKDLDPIERVKTTVDANSLSWTDKYKPQSTNKIIGQQDPESPMKKLMRWLNNWYNTFKQKPKAIPRGTMDSFKCALLSGSPGIGKTTTATLVAKELGFDVVEFNASDTRNKKSLQEEVSLLLSTKSLAGFFKNGEEPTKKHVLLMDEVDGMSGNEDRGGMQELITLIKNSQIPIICMCNDRYNRKITSLANYCVDLRFTKPKMEQIRSAMMSICFKEGLNMSADALTEIIRGTDNDVRQTLTHLYFFTKADKSLSTESAKTEATRAHKDIPLNTWAVCENVFSPAFNKEKKFEEKCKLFFYDYSIGPLFVHENYRNVVPACPANERLRRYAETAHALSKGDVIDQCIRSGNNWSLLEVQAVCSSVLPGYYMQGQFKSRMNFPRWLGSNSKRNKCKRLIGELESHMLKSASVDSAEIALSYVPLLKQRLIQFLKKGDIEEAVDLLAAYNLVKDDVDAIMDLTSYAKIDEFKAVDSKNKAAFTRACKKAFNKLSYTASSKKKVAQDLDDADGELSDESDDDDDITKDKMIVAKTKSTKKTEGDAKKQPKKETKPKSKKSKK